MYKTIVTLGFVLVGLVSACGGMSDADIEATADASVAEKIAVEATAYAKAKAIIEATALAAPTPTPNPTPTPVAKYNVPPGMTIDKNKSYTAVFQMSDDKTFSVDLFPKEVPVTVNNFVFLAKEGFYDGVTFHRIVKGFMIQGGDPQGTGSGGPGYKFDDEPVTRDYIPGTLAMANSGPNTNGSQFFVMHANVALPKNYTIFGLVKEGMDTINSIADTPVRTRTGGEVSLPLTAPIIKRIEIIEQ